MDVPVGYKLVVFTGLASPGQIITGGVEPGDELVSVVDIAPLPVASVDYVGQSFSRKVLHDSGSVGGVIEQIASGFGSTTLLALVRRSAQ
jgi:hypothetical protein